MSKTPDEVLQEYNRTLPLEWPDAVGELWEALREAIRQRDEARAALEWIAADQTVSTPLTAPYDLQAAVDHAREALRKFKR